MQYYISLNLSAKIYSQISPLSLSIPPLYLFLPLFCFGCFLSFNLQQFGKLLHPPHFFSLLRSTMVCNSLVLFIWLFFRMLRKVIKNLVLLTNYSGIFPILYNSTGGNNKKFIYFQKSQLKLFKIKNISNPDCQKPYVSTIYHTGNNRKLIYKGIKHLSTTVLNISAKFLRTTHSDPEQFNSGKFLRTTHRIRNNSILENVPHQTCGSGTIERPK